jgi:enamine deaminase RidA (YjgF/YER057c/UK114 family)
MTVQRYQTTQRYSEICVHAGTVYLAGQVADEVEGRDCADQTRQVLACIDALLAEAGSDKSKLLQVTIWLTSMSNYDAFNSVWDAWIGPGKAPARACVEAQLAKPGWLVEVLVVAAL